MHTFTHGYLRRYSTTGHRRLTMFGATGLMVSAAIALSSAPASARPKPPPPAPPPVVLVAPRLVVVDVLDATGVTIVTDNGNAVPYTSKSYEIFLNGVARPGNYYTGAGQIFDNSRAPLRSLIPDTTYVVTVREVAFNYATSTYVRGPFAAPVTFHTLTRAQSAPTVPTGFVVLPPGPYYAPTPPHTVFVEWNRSTDNTDSSDTLHYRYFLDGVERGVTCSGSVAYCYGESNVGFTNLVPGQTYRLSVEALDSFGNTSARSADFLFVGV